MIRYNLGIFYLLLQICWKAKRIKSICTAQPFARYKNPLEGSKDTGKRQFPFNRSMKCFVSYKRAAILQAPPRQNILYFETHCNH